MHSRIFQIESKPIADEDYITSLDVPDWFTEVFADYVSDDCDREDDIGWLMASALFDIASEEDGKLTFCSDVRRYFKDKYESFTATAANLSDISFDRFVLDNDIDMVLYRLHKAYSDQHGFYVWTDDDLITLDDFMRIVKDNEVYYIGGTVDYHC